MSWREFGDGVRDIAHGLYVVGMCRGQRLGVVARNSDVMLQYMYAAAYLGLVSYIDISISACAHGDPDVTLLTAMATRGVNVNPGRYLCHSTCGGRHRN